MSLLNYFCAVLEVAPVQAVFFAELEPLVALEQAWAVVSCKRAGEAPVSADNILLTLDAEVLLTDATTLGMLAQRYQLGPVEYLCGWFSGVADDAGGHGVLVLFQRADAATNQLRQALCTQTVRAIRNDLLLQSERARYRGWLNEVRVTKEKLLPAADHRVAGIDHAVHYQSSVGGGGDYYELIDLRPARARHAQWGREGQVAVALCDVSGHGPGAAVEVAMIDAIVRTYRGRPQDGPAEVLAYINTHFFTRQLRGTFVTGVLCHVDFLRHRLRWANAGHLPLVVVRRDGPLEVLDQSEGIPIGIDRSATWEVHETPLAPGDGVLLMSDGITEAMSVTGEMFGLERVLQLLQTRPAPDASSVLAHVVAALRRHTAGHSEQDDQTLFYLVFQPGA